MNLILLPYTTTSSLPAVCRACLYWECPAQFAHHPPADTAMVLKQQWVREQGGTISAGVAAYIDETAVGFCHFAVSPFFATVHEYTCGPPSPDALFIACLHVDQAAQGLGVGRQLRLHAEVEAARRGLAASETFARVGNADNPSGPLAFWARAGYSTLRQVEEFALMRKVITIIHHRAVRLHWLHGRADDLLEV